MNNLDEKNTLPVITHDTKEATHTQDLETPISHEVIDTAAERKLLWKVDLHVVPPLSILFLLAFLDRVNIGNAKIQGMTKELNMHGQDYSIALFIFFIP
jgi:hypothetical protein